MGLSFFLPRFLLCLFCLKSFGEPHRVWVVCGMRFCELCACDGLTLAEKSRVRIMHITGLSFYSSFPGRLLLKRQQDWLMTLAPSEPIAPRHVFWFIMKSAVRPPAISFNIHKNLSLIFPGVCFPVKVPRHKYQVQAGRQGHPMLTVFGYTYGMHKNASVTNSRRWRCTLNHKCRAAAHVSHDSSVLLLLSPHSHPPLHCSTDKPYCSFLYQSADVARDLVKWMSK